MTGEQLDQLCAQLTAGKYKKFQIQMSKINNPSIIIKGKDWTLDMQFRRNESGCFVQTTIANVEENVRISTDTYRKFIVYINDTLTKNCANETAKILIDLNL